MSTCVPVEPRDLVVLAVGVVVAALGAAELVAAEQHRHALRQQQRGRAGCAAGGRAGRAIAGSSVGPSTPQFHERLCDSPSRLSSPLASLCLSLYETRSRSVKPSWAVTKLIDAVGRRRVGLVQVGAAGEAVAELGERRRLAAPEVADRVAVAAVPLRPQRREVADLVAALADVPRLGDQLDLATRPGPAGRGRRTPTAGRRRTARGRASRRGRSGTRRRASR